MTRGVRCGACDDVRLGAVLACPSCGSAAVSPTDVDGGGTVVGATRVHAGSTRSTPFDVVLVETPHGLRIVGLADGEVSVGTQVVVVDDDGGVPVYAGRR